MANRFYALDAMRGAAAIVVVIYHAAVITNGACTQATCNVQFGYLAVDMFFALSGFVICHTYEQQLASGLSLWSFMKRRFLRLMPIYWLALFLSLPSVALDLMKGTEAGTDVFGALISNSFVLPWRGSAYAFALVRPAWSLFCELWVANFVYVLLWRQLRGLNLAILLAVSLAALALAANWYGSLDMGPVWMTFPGGTPRVLFSFFMGVALRRIADRVSVPALPWQFVIAVVVASFFIPLHHANTLVFELFAVTILYPGLILLGSRANASDTTVIRALGGASYPLYLIHMPMLDYVTKTIHRLDILPQPAIAAGFVAAAFVVALGVSRYYDERAKRCLATALSNLLGKRTKISTAVVMTPVTAAGAMP